MKVIFYLTDTGLTSYNDKDSLSQYFEWDAIDLIHDHIASISEDSMISLVLDIIDEDIYFEWHPKVLPWEKMALQSRRKERLNVDEILLSEVRWTNTVHENDEGRKEELMLSASVAESFHLSSFFSALEEAQLIVTSIYSKPFLLAEYFKKRVKSYLKFTKQQVEHPFLMVSRQSEFSFRQTFFYEGQLRISRLIEIDSSQSDITSALIKETRLAITYVYNQQIVPFNSPVGLVFLDGDRTVLDGMLDRCKEEALIPVTWEENSFLFGAVAFQDVSPDAQHCDSETSLCFSQSAIVDFVFSDHPKGFYLNNYVKQIGQLVQGRKAFVGVNVLLLLVALYFVLISGIDTYMSLKKQDMLVHNIQEHQTEIIRLEEMVKLQDDAQQVKASVEFSESVLKLKLDRLISFDIDGLSEILARHENIQISDVEWKTLNKFDGQKNQIIMTGWVFPFHETYKKPVEWVDKFISDLASLGGIESIELQKEPLNRKLSKSLSINAKMESVEALPFTVMLRVKDYEPK